jgi:hypothetical protein
MGWPALDGPWPGSWADRPVPVTTIEGVIQASTDLHPLPYAASDPVRAAIDWLHLLGGG